LTANTDVGAKAMMLTSDSDCL